MINVTFYYLFFHVDTIAVGGTESIRLARTDFTFIKAASKPSAMALRLADKLFSKTTLVRSTVHGTKDFDPLDPTRISAIRGESSLNDRLL